MSACTTVAATSEKRTAQTWIDWMSSCLYSGAYHRRYHLNKGVWYLAGFICSYLLEVCLLRALQLLLEEQHNLLNVAAGCQAKNDADSLPANFKIRAMQVLGATCVW